MLFETLYKNLCERGKNLKEQWKPVGSGLQRHRILPQHQGGTYVDSNCTYLTLREHIIAHYLLWRMNGNVGDRDAYQMMSGINPNNYPSWLGRKHTPETKRKMFGRKFTEETRRKLSEAAKGRVGNRKGKTHTDETKKRIGKASSKRNKGVKNPRSKRIKVTYHQIEKIYSYMGLAVKDLSIPASVLSELANGKTKRSTKYPSLRAEYV